MVRRVLFVTAALLLAWTLGAPRALAAEAGAAEGARAPTTPNVAAEVTRPSPPASNVAAEVTRPTAAGQTSPASLPRPQPDRWSRVDVAPTWTSIYIGSVSMRMPTFVRAGDTFSAAYTAKVFPYFFYDETGTLTVNVTDAQLQALAERKPIDFGGTAVNTEGKTRKVTARATPIDPATGKLDVHVWYSKRIQLIFHTTYRFKE